MSHLNYEETVKNSILSSYKNIILIFPVVRKAYLYFCFSLYKMVDSKNNQGNFEFLNVSVGTIIGNPEMLWFVPGHFKTKKMSKDVVKKFPFLVKYVPDRYKTKKCVIKLLNENGGMFEFIPDYYKNQLMCDEAVDHYSHPSRFVPDC